MKISTFWVFGLRIFFLEQHMILHGIINLNDSLTVPVSITSYPAWQLPVLLYHISMVNLKQIQNKLKETPKMITRVKSNYHSNKLFFFNKFLLLFTSNLQILNSKFFFKKTTKKQTNKQKSYYKDKMHINMFALFY